MPHPAQTDFTGDPVPSLVAFATEGSDHGAAQRTYEILASELQPSDGIERLWVRDIALLTVQCAELRLAQQAIHKQIIAEAGGLPDPTAGIKAAVGDSAETDGASQGESPGKELALCGGRGATRDRRQIEAVLARAYTANLAMLDCLVQMEASVRKERDRVIDILNRRRQASANQLLEALD